MKFDAWFLMSSRQAKKKRISESRKEIDFKKGIYLTSSKAINYYSKGGKPKGVETFYFEGNPSPIIVDKEGEDTSIKFLNDYIYENVIEQTGDLPKERGKNAIRWIAENATMANFVKWLMMGLIGYSIIKGALLEYGVF